MALRLKRLNIYSGEKASIYTVYDSDTKDCPYKEFIETWSPEHDEKLINFAARLEAMGNQTGVKDEFLLLNENETAGVGDNVCALYDRPFKEMRLYCVKISEKILILGSGGPKPSHIVAWQDCRNLSRAARFMIFVSEAISPVNVTVAILPFISFIK